MRWATSTDHVRTCSLSGSVLTDGRSAEATQYLNADSSVPQAISPNFPPAASAVPKMRVNGRGEDVIFFDGVFFKSSLKSIFFVS